jgi:hypothetical protein
MTTSSALRDEFVLTPRAERIYDGGLVPITTAIRI